MKKYRTATARRQVNAKRLALFIAVIAAVIVAIVLIVQYQKQQAYLDEVVTLTPEMEEELFRTGTFLDGVTVGGVDVAGMTYSQGEEAAQELKQQMLDSGTIEFTVQDQDAPYTFDLGTMGVSVDVETPLRAAMLYGREGTRRELESGVTEPKDFPVERAFDSSAARTQIETLAENSEWGEDAVNSSYKVNTQNDESGLTTWGTLEKTEPKDGWEVNVESIINTAVSQIENEQYQTFEAQTEVIPSNASTGEAKELVLMGSGTTSFEGSPESRRYNIWKISSQLNGAVFKSWETFSVNDHVGPRNAETGYKEANGIEDGKYTPQYGGGICQVSSTMYNACLKAEMDIVARVPHTIMASYVKPGLDATISTGSPDFKVKNILDDDMYMIVKCNVPDRKVTIEIWGTWDRDYSIELYSEALHEKDGKAPPPEFTVNSALGSYDINELRPSRRYEKYQLYAKKVDSNGKVIEDKIDVGTSTYDAIVGKYEVGSGVPITEGMSYADAKAAAQAAAAAAAAPPPTENLLDPATEAPQQTTDPTPVETPPATPDPATPDPAATDSAATTQAEQPAA